MRGAWEYWRTKSVAVGGGSTLGDEPYFDVD
jgi:hypothetical protein